MWSATMDCIWLQVALWQSLYHGHIINTSSHIPVLYKSTVLLGKRNYGFLMFQMICCDIYSRHAYSALASDNLYRHTVLTKSCIWLYSHKVSKPDNRRCLVGVDGAK